MAKRLLLNALISVLGEFIDINEDNLNLNLAVWSGQIILNNLKLKTDKLLQNFQLNIIHGLIKKLEINIPWTALLNSPVKVNIDGVYLQISPLNNKNININDVKKILLNRKLEKLKLSDRVLDNNNNDSINDKTNKSDSYIQQITTKIIDNLEIQLHNIHFRYEDDISIPHSILSIGITLDSFILATCDENWKLSYVARSNNNKSINNKLYKIAEVKGFGIYWNIHSESLQTLDFDTWINKMYSLIYKFNDIKSDDNKLNYFIKPKNQLTIKMNHCADYTDIVPKYNFIIESSNLSIIYDTIQYKQLDILVNRYALTNYKKYVCTYRPIDRPKNKLLIKKWWIYTCKLVIKKPIYISIYKMYLLNPESVTKQQKELLDQLHEYIPAHVLMIFRQIAMKEIQQKFNQNINNSKQQITLDNNNSWWKWANKSTNTPTLNNKSHTSMAKSPSGIIDDEDVPIDLILDNLKREELSTSSITNISTQSLLFQFHLFSSVTFQLSHINQPIVKSSMSVVSILQYTSIGINIKLDINDMLVIDLYSKNPIIKNILSIHLNKQQKSSNITDKPTCISINYSSCQGKSNLEVISNSFIISFNKLCIQILLGLINLIRLSNGNEIISEDSALNTVNINQDIVRPYHCDFNFIAYSSKIIIPEDSLNDCGYMLIDTGYCNIHGFVHNEGVSINLSLTDINAAMPLHVDEIFTFDQSLLYLIKPFHIEIIIQTVDKSVADMTIGLSFEPEIRGELDPRKLARLFHVIQVITSTFYQVPDLNEEISRYLKRKVNDGKIGSKSSKSSKKETITNDTGISILISEDICINDDDLDFVTPRNTPPMSPFSDNKQKSNNLSSVAKILTELSSNVISPKQVSHNSSFNSNPLSTSLQITCVLPKVVLDLTYDSKLALHLVLILSDSKIVIYRRCYDMTIEFDLNELIIQDSLRCELQRNLAKTPENCQLIHITYVSLSDVNSPYYIVDDIDDYSSEENEEGNMTAIRKYNHGSNIFIKFTDLELNCDIKTLSHLKPFTEVLLYLRSGNSTLIESTNLANTTSNNSANSRPSTAKPKLNVINTSPVGIKIILKLDRIALSLLFPAKSADIGLKLNEAFSLQVTSLYININMKSLMKSTVTLKSFDIVDLREISKDYAYHTILSPNQMNNNTSDLLTITYYQENSNTTIIDINVSHIKFLVSMDSIIDLSDVLLGNFFGILDLLSSPSPNRLSLLLTEYLSHYKQSIASKGDLNKSDKTKEKQYSLSNQENSIENNYNTLYYTMNIKTHIHSPQLIILDDPTSEDSQSIVGKCNIELVYTRELSLIPLTFNSKELIDQVYDRHINESIHISSRELQLFVQRNISLSNCVPKLILEPFDIEYHIKRRLVNQNTTYTGLVIDIDTINAKLSIEDIILFQSIMIRRLVSTVIVDDNGFDDYDNNYSQRVISKPMNSSNNGNLDLTDNSKIETLDSSVDKPVNRLSELEFHLQINLQTLNLITINDHIRDYSYPLFQTNVEQFSLFLDGVINKHIIGEGTFKSSTNYYNSSIDQWEVLLERCKPIISIDIYSKSTIIEIKSYHTLMITLSNHILQKFIEIYSYFTYKDKLMNLSNTSSTDMINTSVSNLHGRVKPEVTIINDLGNGIDITIHDSETKTLLVQLLGNDRSNISKHLEYIDIDFVSTFGLNKQSLHYLPVLSNGIKMFYILGENQNSNSKDDSLKSTEKDQLVIDPIIEEIYENSRYDIITNLWRLPFLFGDPDEYTDKSMTVRKSLSTVDVEVNNYWIYLDSWTVDMNGIVDVEIDQEGWEYSTTFNNFSISSRKHSIQQLDCVRRRRWIRYKIPKLSSTQSSDVSIDVKINKHQYLPDPSLSSFPFSFIYESTVLKSGNRLITFRSNKQIFNNLCYKIELLLSCKLWLSDVILGPIAVNQHFNIPLLCSQATHIKFRPFHDNQKYKWSNSISISIQSTDYTIHRDIQCNLKKSNMSNSISNKSIHPNVILSNNVSINQVNKAEPMKCKLFLNQSKKSLTISCLPYITIRNALPLDFEYQVYQCKELIELNTINSGSSIQLLCCNPSIQLYITIKLGDYLSSEPQLIDFTKISKNKISNYIILYNTVDVSNEIGAMLTMDIKLNENSTFEISIYSKSALIDKSRLDMSIWCNINANGDLSTTRNTYAINSNMDNGFEKLSYSGSNTDLKAESLCDKQLEDKYLIIHDFTVDSKYEYSLTRLNSHINVYSDRNTISWKYLPKYLRRGHPIIIQPSFNDKMSRSRNLISFRLSISSVVLLLIDNRLINRNIIPKWIIEDGFEPVIGQAIATRSSSSNHVIEYNYGFYGKYIHVNGNASSKKDYQLVTLKGNWNKLKGFMYSVIILNDPKYIQFNNHINNDPITKQFNNNNEANSSVSDNSDITSNMFSVLQSDYNLIFHQLLNSPKNQSLLYNLRDSWINGGYGYTLFHSFNDVISIGILKQKLWSEGINIDPKHKKDGNLNIIDWNTCKEYQLYYNITYWPSIYQSTQLITVYPTYCIVNGLMETIHISQRGSPLEQYFTVQPFTSEPFHKIDTKLGNVLHIRTQSTNWSIGTIDITDIGSTLLYLPSNTSTNENPYIIHVEIKKANINNNEYCEFLILIWKSVVNSSTIIPILSIRNESDVYITVCQDEIDFDSIGYEPKTFEIVIPPGNWIPFGWIDPESSQRINLVIGKHLFLSSNRYIAKINPSDNGEIMRLSDHTGRLGTAGEVIISMTILNGGKILTIRRCCTIQRISQFNISNSYKFNLSVNLKSFGLSLILDKPKRNEFMSLYIDQIIFKYITNSSNKSIYLSINDIQLDNYSETVIYPIVLRSKSKEVHQSVTDTIEEFEISNDQNNQIIENPWLKLDIEQIMIDKFISYEIELKVLSSVVNIDTSTIQLLYYDLIKGLYESTIVYSYISLHSIDYINKYNYQIYYYHINKSHVNVYNSLLYSSIQKLCIKKLNIHQMKLYLTVMPTPFPRSIESDDSLQVAVLNILKEFTSIDSLPIKFKSFEMCDALETYESISLCYKNQLLTDISISLGKVIGYLSLIGSPMTFAKKISKGVKAFFYEPFIGATQSPQDFILGLGKGTSTLVNNVVTGTLDSTVSVVGTAAKGVSYLSGDPEYIRKRALKRSNKQKQLNLYDSILDSSNSIASGIKSGVKGLITKPIEEVNKSGPLGLFRGIGLGILGVAVKPVMGLSDGITTLANGISNSITNNLGIIESKDSYVRPSRVFQRSNYNTNELIITPLDLNAIYAQDFILSRAKSGNYIDSYLDYMSLESPSVKSDDQNSNDNLNELNISSNESIILSSVFLYYKKSDNLTGRPWYLISHIICIQHTYDIHIILYSSQFEIITISCYTKAQTITLYMFLSKYNYLMGNPSLVIPSYLLKLTNTLNNNNEYSLLDIIRKMSFDKNKNRCINMSGEIDGYRFGSKNGLKLPFVYGYESDFYKKSYDIFKIRYNYRELDERLYRFIWEWECIHATTNKSKCILLLILNKTNYNLQINSFELLYGKEIKIFGSINTGYSSELSILLPQGYVILFTNAFPKTPMEIGSIKLIVKSNVFSLCLSTKHSESNILSYGGFNTGFLEKTMKDWWSKYAVFID